MESQWNGNPILAYGERDFQKAENGNTKLVIQKRFLTNTNRERLKLDDEIKVFFNEP
jgi:hypothetical protein